LSKYIIASDIGGSGTKSMAYDISNNEVSETAFCESNIYHPKPDVTIQKSKEIYDSVIQSIKKLVNSNNVESKNIEAIIVDGQQGGIMWIDEKHKPISEYDSWMDNRYAKYVKTLKIKCGNRIFKKAGTNNVIHAPKILWWKENNPNLLKKAKKMVIPATFVGGLLAGLYGEEGYIENTSLGFSGLTNKEQNEWDQEICKELDIPIDLLPEIKKPDEIIGYLSKEAANSLGIQEGIPIIAGVGDFPAAGLGAGIVEEGMAGDIAGTASLFFTGIKSKKPDEEEILRFVRSPIRGLWYAFAFMTGGGCLRWYRDNFFGNYKKDIYEVLNEKIGDVPLGCNGLKFFPYIGGRHHPLGVNHKGGWLGIKWSHSKEDFYRAILESIAFEYRKFLNKFNKITDIHDVKGFGGGVSSDIWNQIKSNVLNLEYKVLQEHECSLLGSVIVAGKAIGKYDDMTSKAIEFNNVKTKYLPDKNDVVEYEKYYERYFEIIENHDSIFT